jgi:hypothetical protein
MITKKLVKSALRCNDRQAEQFRYLWERPKKAAQRQAKKEQAAVMGTFRETEGGGVMSTLADMARAIKKVTPKAAGKGRA